MVTAATAGTNQAHAMLWTELSKLEDRFSNMEVQFATLQLDHARVMLRQIAGQFENKLARYVAPGLTPRNARHTTFKRLQKGQLELQDMGAFQSVVGQFPGLEGGLEVLKELCDAIVPPTAERAVDGSEKAVTREVLQELIDLEFCDGDPVKPDVITVLACLEFMAEKLDEPLFVPGV